MWPPPVDGDGALILRDLGFRWGRTSAGHQLGLEYRGGGGEGLLLTAAIGAEPLILWVPETVWCAWASAILPVGAWRDVPDDHGPVLAQWTLLPLQPTAGDAHFAEDPDHGADADRESSVIPQPDGGDESGAGPGSWEGDHDLDAMLADDDARDPHGVAGAGQEGAPGMPEIVDARLAPGSLDDVPGWWITLEDGPRLLSMRVVRAPAGWLARLAAGMRLRSPAAPGEPLALTVLAGWSRIPASTWRTLECGDALLLESGAEPDAGRLWVRFGELCLTVQCEAAMDLGDGASSTEAFEAEAAAEIQAADEVRDPGDIGACTMQVLAAQAEPGWSARPAGSGDLRCVLAEMGSAYLPAGQFTAMAVGATIVPRLSSGGMILLRDVSGALLATGDLVQIGRRLAVRINEKIAMPAPASQTSRGEALPIPADQVDT